MIGGEFDLSSGVMTGTTGMFTGIFAVEVGMNIWLGMALSLAIALAIGFLNGYMVVKSGLPSFIVTLGTFFILRGFNLWLTQRVTGLTNVTGVETTRAPRRRARSSPAPSSRSATPSSGWRSCGSS